MERGAPYVAQQIQPGLAKWKASTLISVLDFGIYERENMKTGAREIVQGLRLNITDMGFILGFLKHHQE